MALCRLGTPIATPGFHRASYLYPPGMLVAWQDAKKTVTIFTSIATVRTAGTAGTAAADEQMDTGDAGDAETDGDAGPPRPQEKPLFTVTAVRGDVKPPEAGTLADAFGDAAIELATSNSTPDDVCNELFALQKLAKTLPRPSDDGESASPPAAEAAAAGEAVPVAAAAATAAAAGDKGLGSSKGEKQEVAEKRERQLATLNGDPKLLALLQELSLPPVRWPRLLFGLSHAAVLTKLEGHEAVEHCMEYMYVEVFIHLELFHLMP